MDQRVTPSRQNQLNETRMVNRAYKVRLYPTQAQRVMLDKTLGCWISGIMLLPTGGTPGSHSWEDKVNHSSNGLVNEPRIHLL